MKFIPPRRVDLKNDFYKKSKFDNLINTETNQYVSNKLITESHTAQRIFKQVKSITSDKEPLSQTKLSLGSSEFIQPCELEHSISKFKKLKKKGQSPMKKRVMVINNNENHEKENICYNSYGVMKKGDALKSVYAVLYSKFSNKKHKAYKDGILVLEKKTATLLHLDGQIIGKTQIRINQDDMLSPGNTLQVGTNELEITEAIAWKDYQSGKIFLKNHSIHNASYKNNFSVNLKLQFKSVRSMEQKYVDVGKKVMIEPKPMFDPLKKDALICYDGSAVKGTVMTVVDPVISKKLRPHQREGVRFLFNCVTNRGSDAVLIMNGLYPSITSNQFRGCILADEMGLGKTLQVIALVWTLLQQCPFLHGKPWCRKCVIVTPSSLAKNWEKEFKKWLGIERIKPLVVSGTQRETEVIINDFCNLKTKRVLIISYEMFRKYSNLISKNKEIDLLCCDEGHRLKASTGNQTIRALKKCTTSRRIILTGTPVQNELDEFYAMVDFVNPGALGSDIKSFRRLFQKPIEIGTDKNAKDSEKDFAAARTDELNDLTKTFIIRRSAQLNSSFLPPCNTIEIFLRLAHSQILLYQKAIDEIFSSSSLYLNGGAEALSLICTLRQLCTHPSLMKNLNECAFNVYKNNFSKEVSPKFYFLQLFLKEIRFYSPTDKTVLVSNSTKTLNLLEILCKNLELIFLRIDGSTKPSDRQTIVDRFNTSISGPTSPTIFLLSSRAGGCGLNLTGANRLVLIDLDWNPAIDKQAAARIWRDGQTKPVYIYRLITTGTIEERIFQRQLFKLFSAKNIINTSNTLMKNACANSLSTFSKEELKQLFKYKSETVCNTYDLQKELPEDQRWSFYHGPSSCSDSIVRKVVETLGESIVTWVHNEQYFQSVKANEEYAHSEE